MDKEYNPPFSMNENITNLVIEIGEITGKLGVYNQLSTNLKLRRKNRIKTIYSSLAIEQNTMTLEQVSDVIDGKRILAPPKDIKEVKNAYEAYEHLNTMNPYSLKDLLQAHKYMTEDLIDESGTFRSTGAGVYAGDKLIHAGTPPQYIPALMDELFLWLKDSKLHPLVKSCIFHYEFEFIHPFKDGNGRTGRLWHTLLLSQWKEFFAWIPIESMIHEHQNEYYRALNQANSDAESTVFVEFMLKMIRDTLLEIGNSQKENILEDENLIYDVGNYVGNYVGKRNISIEDAIIALMSENQDITLVNIANMLQVSKRQVERIVRKLRENKRIVRLGSNRNGHWKVI